MVASSDAANPRVPVPKSRVVSLSPTFAGRDLMLWRLKSHIWELSYWESPSASSKFTLFPFRTHQSKSDLKLELQPGHVRFVPKVDIMRCSKRQLDQSDCRCPFLISLLSLQVGTVIPPRPNSLDQGRFWEKADMDNLDFHIWA